MPKATAGLAGAGRTIAPGVRQVVDGNAIGLPAQA